MLQERKAPVNVVSVDNPWQEWWRIHPWKHMITPSHIVGMNTGNAALNWNSKREPFINIMQRVIRTRKAITRKYRDRTLTHAYSKAEQANPRRHVHWKSEHDEPVNLSISRQTSYDSASRIVPSYNPMKTHRIPHCSQQSQNDCHITFIMNKPRNPASWTHTTTAFIENMKPMKSINKQHIHHTLRNRTTFAHPERNSHEQTSTKPLPNHPCGDNHLKRQYTQ